MTVIICEHDVAQSECPYCRQAARATTQSTGESAVHSYAWTREGMVRNFAGRWRDDIDYGTLLLRAENAERERDELAARLAACEALTTRSECKEDWRYKRHYWQWDKKLGSYYCGNCQLYRVGQPDKLVPREALAQASNESKP